MRGFPERNLYGFEGKNRVNNLCSTKMLPFLIVNWFFFTDSPISTLKKNI